MVRFTEWNPLGHQIVRQLGGVGVAALRRRHGALAVDLQIDQYQRRHVEAVEPGIEGIKQPLFVFLHVLVVGQWQRLEAHQHAHLGADHPTGLATDQLQRIGVLLLRHQGGA